MTSALTTDSVTTDAAAASAWTRLGLTLGASESPHTPDLERLLLATARLSPSNIRLFTAAGTWLASFSAYVAGSRLAQLTLEELEQPHHPALGLLLETFAPRQARLKKPIRLCEASLTKTTPFPLALAEHHSALLTHLSQKRAAPLSQKWKRWASASTLTPRPELLRDVEWITARNPALALRALLTDADASICAASPNTTAESKTEVARHAGLDRLSTTHSLHRLHHAGLIRLHRQGRRESVTFLYPLPLPHS